MNQDDLKQILEYNQETGVFVWIINCKNGIKCGSIAGSFRKDGYVYIKIQGKKYPAHKLAWLYLYGKFPNNDIDHINRIKNDNRIVNLREANRKQNLQNINNYSGLGASYCSEKNKYRAVIKVNDKQLHLGYFMTEKSAHNAYLKAKRELHSYCTI